MTRYKGVRNTSPSLLEMCRAFLGTRRQAVWKIVLPQPWIVSAPSATKPDEDEASRGARRAADVPTGSPGLTA